MSLLDRLADRIEANGFAPRGAMAAAARRLDVSAEVDAATGQLDAVQILLIAEAQEQAVQIPEPDLDAPDVPYPPESPAPSPLYRLVDMGD